MGSQIKSRLFYEHGIRTRVLRELIRQWGDAVYARA